MKKIVLFISLFIVCTNSLQSMIEPSFFEEEVPMQPAMDDQDRTVPYSLKVYLKAVPNITLRTERSIEIVNASGIKRIMIKKIPLKLNLAHQLIAHGNNTGQLRSMTRKESLDIREILAIQLLQLDTDGVDAEGHLDPKLTVLADLFVDNPLAHHIVPFIFQDEEPQVVPGSERTLSRKLFRS